MNESYDVECEILNNLFDAQESLIAARNKIHEYVDKNNLPNARLSPEVAKIGESIGNIINVKTSIKGSGLPTE